jgi:hypothetical protein
MFQTIPANAPVAVHPKSGSTIPDMKFKVLDLLCQANDALDDIVAAESVSESFRTGGFQTRPLPRISRGSIQHHVVALAGVLKRTSAHSITASVGGIIATARRAR